MFDSLKKFVHIHDLAGQTYVTWNDMHTEKQVIARFTLPPLIRATLLDDWLDVVPAVESMKQLLDGVKLAQRVDFAQGTFPTHPYNQGLSSPHHGSTHHPKGLSLLSNLCSAPRPGWSSAVPLLEGTGPLPYVMLVEF